MQPPPSSAPKAPPKPPRRAASPSTRPTTPAEERREETLAADSLPVMPTTENVGSGPRRAKSLEGRDGTELRRSDTPPAAASATKSATSVSQDDGHWKKPKPVPRRKGNFTTITPAQRKYYGETSSMPVLAFARPDARARVDAARKADLAEKNARTRNAASLMDLFGSHAGGAGVAVATSGAGSSQQTGKKRLADENLSDLFDDTSGEDRLVIDLDSVHSDSGRGSDKRKKSNDAAQDTHRHDCSRKKAKAAAPIDALSKDAKLSELVGKLYCLLRFDSLLYKLKILRLQHTYFGLNTYYLLMSKNSSRPVSTLVINHLINSCIGDQWHTCSQRTR